MLLNDARGVSWTASSAASGQKLFEAIGGYLTFRSNTLSIVDELVDEDPDCPMAWVLRGYLLLFARSAALVPDAHAALVHAEALGRSATPRERLHINALEAWIAADPLKAQMLWSNIISDSPHDLLALRVQHFNAIFLGRSKNLARLARRTLSDWSDDVPGAGFAWSTACMGLEEVGEFTEAERIGRQGSELEPDDLWAVHSVAHVMEAEGRLDDGLEWMKRPDSFWAGRGPMRHHLWWHEALFMYEAGDYDRVLDYYDACIAPKERISYMEMSNASSLLLRLESAGVACGERWNSLAEETMHLIDSRGLTFSDVHLLLVYGMADDTERFGNLSQSIADYSLIGTYDAEAADRVARPLAAVFKARASHNFELAANTLYDVRANFVHMGGSNAQRDALEILLVDCAVTAGKTDMARDLVEQYLSVRPESVPMRQQFAALENA